MLMSLSGIVFGVAFFVVTQAQTAGFQAHFINTILGVNGMVRVEDRIRSSGKPLAAEADSAFGVVVAGGVRYIPGIEYPEALQETIAQIPGVTASSAVVRGNAVLSANFREYDCKPHGIDLTSFVAVSDLAKQIVDGSLAAFSENPFGVLVGIRIANRLKLNVGDSILLQSTTGPVRFRVSAFYETGIEQVDRERVYLHQAAARSLLNRPVGASFIQIAITDAALAPEFAERIEQNTGYYTASWQEREKTWIQVFRVLRISSALTISTIILISGLGMFNTLVMIVTEKTREIAILRSMGYTRGDISGIFMSLGGIILALGIMLGWVFALVATYGISRVPIRIRGIFASDHFIVAWDIAHYIWAAVIASVIVLIASYLPARRAARLEPGDVIRGSST